MSLWPEQETSPKISYEDLADPKHWFIARQDKKTGDWYVYNFTAQQRLLGDYESKELANRAIKAIASRNPRFRERSRS